MIWAGVDVGGRRKGFHLALVDHAARVALAHAPTVPAAVDRLTLASPRLVAVDSPRTTAAPGETARACERRLAREVCGIRWTPDEATVRGGNPYYDWVLHGLDLYEALAAAGLDAVECFPTASWTRWAGARGPRTRARWTRGALEQLCLFGVPPRLSQDERDAIAAALTARAVTCGDAEAVGEIAVPLTEMPATG